MTGLAIHSNIRQTCFYTSTRHTRVLAEILDGLGFLKSVSHIKSIPTHEKKMLWEKSGPNVTFNLFFWGWVGLGLGRVRRFHNSMYMFPNPT